MGVVRPGQVLASLGTSGTLVAPVDTPAVDERGRLHTFCHAVPNCWYVMGVVLSAGGSLRWFRDALAEPESVIAAVQGRDPYEVIMDEAALVRALDSGHLGGAGLDVFEVEPLAGDSPLRAFENVLLSPHAAAWTDEAEARLLDVCGANLRRALDGQEPFNVVNGVTRRR